MGRPLALTPAKRARLLQGLKAGLWKRDAATYAGISEATLHAYLVAGEKARGAGVTDEFSELLESVEQAQVGVKLLVVGTIVKTVSEGNWRAAAWMLERMYPSEYGRRDAKAIEHTGPHGIEDLLGGQQPVDVPLAAREEIAAVLERYAESQQNDTIEGTAFEVR